MPAFPRFMRSAGFTMIELLVVIAVIGVLAVAVLSSINPIEQINKGRDTRTRSDAAQLINAIDRYYAIHEEYPWNSNFSGSAVSYSGVGSAGSPFSYDIASGGSGMEWLQLLSQTQEVKQGFVNRLLNDNAVYIWKATGENETMYACFEPSSQAFVQEANNNCDDGGTLPEFCNLANSGSGAFSGVTANLICLP